ncbi:hypothetical protein QMZ92_11335 [Streptomyces sp. HNM0645]|uniref:hypothetical protein n=1 Tax=Streptomyces sp. HNM0645 TaxID=2782343 RepID=UPI0024B8505F|nr:hypothetical protein [Streptomyces sp. HNM0645]MDI9884967.1 hypothetical protein [Streptomyces sp. HNM0645]
MFRQTFPAAPSAVADAPEAARFPASTAFPAVLAVAAAFVAAAFVAAAFVAAAASAAADGARS